MLHFKRIYFDSSVLIFSNWPKISSALERVFDLSRFFKVGLFFPRTVEDELEVHWVNSFRDRCLKAHNATEGVKKYVAGLVKEEGSIVLPSQEVALDGYRKLAQQVKEEWKIETVPYPSRDVGELLKMAVQHQPPFSKEDKGFKDAIIYLSVIDHLAKTPSEFGAFISGDRIFADEKVDDLAKSAGVSLIRYSNTDDLYNELMSWLEGAMKLGWEKDKQRAEEALKQRIPDIEGFLLENLELSKNEIGLGTRLVVIQGLKVSGIKNVRTPPLTERAKNEPVKISFDTQLELRVMVERLYLPPPPSRLKVGEQAPRVETLTLSDVLRGPIQEEQVLPWIAEVEALSPPGDSEYKNIELVSVRSKGLSLRAALLGLNLGSLLSK